MKFSLSELNLLKVRKKYRKPQKAGHRGKRGREKITR